MIKNGGFSITTHWISILGDTRNKSAVMFKLIGVFYILFNLFSVNKLQLLLSSSLLEKLSVSLFYIYTLSLTLILFYPVNKNYKIHRVLSDIAFSSLLWWITLILFQLYKARVVPPLILLLLTITAIIGFIFLFSFTKLRIGYKEIPKTLTDLRKSEKSFLIKTSCLMEWLFFFLVVICQLLLTALP